MTQTNNFITGLIIKEEHYGENAKLLSVLTAENGIMKMKAPGAKNLKSSTHSAVQLFTYSEFSVAKGKGGYLTITGATAKNNFFGLRNDVLNYALACYFSSAVSKVSVNDNSSSDILRLMLNCFFVLSEKKYPPDIVKPFFEIKLASICGFAPDTSYCPSCSSKADTFTFDFFTSGILCKKCARESGAMIKSHRFFQLNSECIKALELLCYSDLKKIFHVRALLSDEKSQMLFREFSERFICNIFESTPKTLSFYNHLMRSIDNEKLRQKQENS